VFKISFEVSDNEIHPIKADEGILNYFFDSTLNCMGLYEPNL
jgi:hypothetical protein